MEHSEKNIFKNIFNTFNPQNMLSPEKHQTFGYSTIIHYRKLYKNYSTALQENPAARLDGLPDHLLGQPALALPQREGLNN